MRRRSGNGSEDFRLEITSLIDIMFLLIMFLVLTNTFTVSQGQFKVNLPTAVTSSQTPQNQKVLTIVVTESNDVFVNDTNIGVSGLVSFLSNYVQQYGNPSSVEIQADKKASYGVVVQVMDALRMQKLYNVDLIVQKTQ